jgi:hypothetical protein
MPDCDCCRNRTCQKHCAYHPACSGVGVGVGVGVSRQGGGEAAARCRERCPGSLKHTRGGRRACLPCVAHCVHDGLLPRQLVALGHRLVDDAGALQQPDDAPYAERPPADVVPRIVGRAMATELRARPAPEAARAPGRRERRRKLCADLRVGSAEQPDGAADVHGHEDQEANDVGDAQQPRRLVQACIHAGARGRPHGDESAQRVAMPAVREEAAGALRGALGPGWCGR